MKSSQPEALKLTLNKAQQSGAAQGKLNCQAVEILFEASNKEGSENKICVVSAEAGVLASREKFCLHQVVFGASLFTSFKKKY